MKGIIGSIMLMFIIVLSGLAQVSKHAYVEESEVPVAVRQSFEETFGEIPDDGKWKVYYTMAAEGDRMVAQPKWYTFLKKEKGVKIEARFTPAGELMFSKGLESQVDTR